MDICVSFFYQHTNIKCVPPTTRSTVTLNGIYKSPYHLISLSYQWGHFSTCGDVAGEMLCMAWPVPMAVTQRWVGFTISSKEDGHGMFEHVVSFFNVEDVNFRIMLIFIYVTLLGGVGYDLFMILWCLAHYHACLITSGLTSLVVHFGVLPSTEQGADTEHGDS